MTQSNPIAIIFSRHQPDLDRINFLKNVFGPEVQVLNFDIRYGDNPVETISDFINEIEVDFDGNVVAIEPVAPFPVLIKIVDAKRQLGVKILRSVFARDSFGRIVVTGQDSSGRDIFMFDRYEELIRIEFQVADLTPIS